MSFDIGTILTEAPKIVTLLKSVIETFGSASKPAPNEPAAHASPAIKHLQALLNVVVKPTPPLAEDGWLGPQTEAVIETGIALLKAKGIGA